ncbi:MAG: hydrogenase nickel incorporation protein HypB [Anaerolineae bacterium]|nr:hydrogenase nickel incorporation protein HypB [Anaerolineae bacterium]MDW8097964.1 hydrogenase nickel incorporation protein HypB [Anaerolineae bacterium]
MREIRKVKEQVLNANDRLALENRARLDRAGVLAVNLIASPGAGKTSLILRTIEALRDRARLAVIEGDLASRVDADRVQAAGVPAIQINTGGGCHLDASMIAQALTQLPLEAIDLLLIENVGNLVCPTQFVLGEHRRVLVASVPEGHDKPIKYPTSFMDMDAIVLNKIDLMPYIDFDWASFERAVRAVNRDAPIFQVSCRTGEGIAAWIAWLHPDQ